MIREHPEDVFAKTGRAEVLKVQGKLPEALSAFEQVIESIRKTSSPRPAGRKC